MTTVIALLKAIRPPTLLAGLNPVILGGVYGLKRSGRLEAEASSFHEGVVTLLLCGLAIILLQTGANLVNDAKTDGQPQTAAA